MRLSYKTIASLGATHAFRGGDAEPLSFVLTAAVRSALAGRRVLARTVQGRLLLACELDVGDAPVASLGGTSLLLGLAPADPAFALTTQPPVATTGALPLFENRSDPRVLDPPLPVQLRAAGPAAAGVVVDAELAQAAPWGLLKLNVDASFYTAPATLTLALAARAETLRYYVVAQRYGAAEFDQVRVVDRGFADDGRPEVQFQRVLPADFGSQHLAPALLDAAGSGRIALFESTAPVARRARALRRLSLQRNGDVLVEHLPLPGAARPDAQFVVHLSKPS